MLINVNAGTALRMCLNCELYWNCEQLAITSLIHWGSLQRWWKFNTCSTDSNAYLFYVSFAGLGLGLVTAGHDSNTGNCIADDPWTSWCTWPLASRVHCLATGRTRPPGRTLHRPPAYTPRPPLQHSLGLSINQSINQDFSSRWQTATRRIKMNTSAKINF